MVLSLCEVSEPRNADGVRSGNAGVDAECCHGVSYFMMFLSQVECIQSNFLELDGLVQAT